MRVAERALDEVMAAQVLEAFLSDPQFFEAADLFDDQPPEAVGLTAAACAGLATLDETTRASLGELLAALGTLVPGDGAPPPGEGIRTLRVEACNVTFAPVEGRYVVLGITGPDSAMPENMADGEMPPLDLDDPGDIEEGADTAPALETPEDMPETVAEDPPEEENFSGFSEFPIFSKKKDDAAQDDMPEAETDTDQIADDPDAEAQLLAEDHPLSGELAAIANAEEAHLQRARLAAWDAALAEQDADEAARQAEDRAG